MTKEKWKKLIISDKNSEYIRFIERLLPNLFCMNMHSLAKPLIVEMLLETGHIFRKYAFFTPSPLSEASLWQSKCGCTCRLSRCPLSVRRLSFEAVRYTPRSLVANRCSRLQRSCPCCFEDLGR